MAEETIQTVIMSSPSSSSLLSVGGSGGGGGAAAAVDHQSWNETILKFIQIYHMKFVKKADQYLDAASKIDLTSATTIIKNSGASEQQQQRQPMSSSWMDEWELLKSFFNVWVEHRYHYWQLCKDAFDTSIQAIRSVTYCMWITISPFMKCICYVIFRIVQGILGKLLPTIQYICIEICRFHIHLTWRQAMGEILAFIILYLFRKLYFFLKQQKYIQRGKKYVQQKSQQITKTVQSLYKEIAHVSLLFAMAIPHGTYMAIVGALWFFRPSFIVWLATETIIPQLLTFLYPLAATIVVLHHARGVTIDNNDADDESKDKKKEGGKKKKSITTTTDKKKKKKANKRRRSSLGALLLRTAPGETQGAGASEHIVYTEEELQEDVNYWLHFWCLSTCLHASYILASRIMIIGSFVINPRVSVFLSCLNLLFHIWLFLLPQCLLILFPSAVEEERRDWSPVKQFCYESALQPVLAMAPTLFQPVIIPLFEKVSQAIPKSTWKYYVVDKTAKILDLAVMLRLLKEENKVIFLEGLGSVHTLVLPALTLFSPGFITQHGVWYVQYIVPLAYSFRALSRDYRHAQRVLYLKFYVVAGLVSAMLTRITTMLWWMPFSSHISFIIWSVLVLSRPLTFLYYELDRELQAFGFLPPVAGDLSVENTHTVRALSFIAAKLPKADSAIEDDKTGSDNNDAAKEKKQNSSSSGDANESKGSEENSDTGDNKTGTTIDSKASSKKDNATKGDDKRQDDADCDDLKKDKSRSKSTTERNSPSPVRRSRRVSKKVKA